ncbi:MAG: copper amine oxidase N-terminal domain-containing protein [Clostridia bacterium]|nr:copper amine oxidase N-terminal domain-containing protein [Clostridia bacterium]
MKKIIVSAAAAGIAFSCSISAFARDIAVFYNNDKVNFDVHPEIIQDRTMVPLRGIFEKMGCNVTYIESEKRIDAQRQDLKISLVIGSSSLYKNNEEIIIDVPPLIKEDRTLIPLRAVSEAFSCKVTWYPLSRVVEISDTGEVMAEEAEKVTDYVLSDASGYPAEAAEQEFFNPENWSSAEGIENGVRVFMDNKFVPSYYTKSDLSNRLIKFRMKITNPNSWPTIALNANNTTDYYETGDCYMFNFYEGHIGLQRFNKGIRTVIMDDRALGEQVVGNGVLLPDGKPVRYDTEYEVTVGTLNEETGVRVVLIVDGETVINYLDKSRKQIRGGYMGIYAGDGSFTFTPASE